jgi:hypothetical protein
MKTLIQRFTQLIPTLLRHSAELLSVALLTLPAHSATETYVIERAETKDFRSASLGYQETQLLGFDRKNHLRLKVVPPYAWNYLGQWHGIPGSLNHYSASGIALAEQSGLNCDLRYDLGATYLSNTDFEMIKAYFDQLKTCAIQVEFNVTEKKIESITQVCPQRRGQREAAQTYKFSHLSATTCPNAPKNTPIKFVASDQPIAAGAANDLDAKLNFQILKPECARTTNERCARVELNDSKGNRYVVWAFETVWAGDWVYKIQSFPYSPLGSDGIAIRKEEFEALVNLAQRKCELTLTADPNTRVIEQVTYRDCQVP